jgi:hypothetical protein
MGRPANEPLGLSGVITKASTIEEPGAVILHAGICGGAVG